MTIKRCLIIDTETTGIDPKDHDIIEIAVILHSLETNTVLGAASLLLPHDSNAAEEVNRISVASLREMEDLGGVIKGFGSLLYNLIDAADVFIAQRASFDKGHLTKENLDLWTSKPWLCTKEDFLFRHGRPGDSLVSIALAHGVPVHDNHRAGTDVSLLSKIFRTYTPEELQALFQHAMLPRDYYVALTGFKDKEKPKGAGFTWNGEKKVWFKKLTPAEASKIDFPIQKTIPEAVGA